MERCDKTVKSRFDSGNGVCCTYTIDMTRLSRATQLSVLFLLLATCTGCDQAAKLLATVHLSNAQPIVFLNGLVRLEYAENSGAFLSLGSRLPPSARFLLLEVMVGGLLLFGFFTIFSNRFSNLMTLRQKAVLALAMGGGLGNLIDRVLHGAVVDFVSLGIGPLRTGIFNLADVAITVGMIGVLWLTGTEPAPAAVSAPSAPSAPSDTVETDD